jgi:hypothetical protein
MSCSEILEEKDSSLYSDAIDSSRSIESDLNVEIENEHSDKLSNNIIGKPRFAISHKLSNYKFNIREQEFR